MREKVSLVNVVSCQQVWYYSSSALRLATNLPSLVLEYPHTSIALYQLPYHTWSLVLFISHRNYFFVNFKDSPPHFYDARMLSFIKELDAKPAVFVTVVSVVAPCYVVMVGVVSLSTCFLYRSGLTQLPFRQLQRLVLNLLYLLPIP